MSVPASICRGCGARISYSGRGRPRFWCERCREPRLTAHRQAARTVYLYAFDLFVHAKADEEKHALWTIMRRAATDAGIPISTRPDNGRDLVDRLAALVRSRRSA